MELYLSYFPVCSFVNCYRQSHRLKGVNIQLVSPAGSTNKTSKRGTIRGGFLNNSLWRRPLSEVGF